MQRLLPGALLRALPERTWQDQVTRTAERMGWWWWHAPANVTVCSRCGFRNFRHMRAGLPDLLLLRGKRKLWLELKAEQGRRKPEQRRVHELLRASGDQVEVLKPRDMERLLELLSGEDAER